MRVKIFAWLITLFIISILILSGPASALFLGISITDKSIFKGETTNFIISVETQNEFETIESLTLELNGKSSVYTCKFNSNGTILQGCIGMNISVSDEEFGYGYNNLDKIKFNIALDTSYIDIGKYKSRIRVLGSRPRNKPGPSFEVRPSQIQECSIRGNKGSLVVEGLNFGSKNKINFYIPNINAVPGEGVLEGKKGKDSFSYSFHVDSVLNDSSNNIVLQVSGAYKVGREKAIKQEAIINIIDLEKIQLTANNFSLENMNVIFKKGC